ncbi:GroES-like superfamily [Sesbania bispinosa]|nr:GroES-like superfamily [Sesbania bispinosa]
MAEEQSLDLVRVSEGYVGAAEELYVGAASLAKLSNPNPNRDTSNKRVTVAEDLKIHIFSEGKGDYCMEAVGVVTAVGAGLTGVQIGDLVGYVGQPMGSYAEEQILPANKVVPIPSTIEPAIAASFLLKGMTTQFLIQRCFKVGFYNV